MKEAPPKPPAALNRFVQMVLSYHPKPKSKPAKRRKRRATKHAGTGWPPSEPPRGDWPKSEPKPPLGTVPR